MVTVNPRPTVAEAMVTIAKTWPCTTTAAQARAVFENPKVQMMLLTDDGVLVGAVLREDLDPALPDTAPVLGVATLQDRTVTADLPIPSALDRMAAHGLRRLAVVDDDSRLLGLLCLKRDRTGFCTDQGVAARAAERAAREAAPVRA